MLAQTDHQLIDSLCDGLNASAVAYALTGAAAAARVAPFISTVHVAEVWLEGTADANEICSRVGAKPVESGPNIVFLQELDDGPLMFQTREDGVWTANVFRLYVDLRRDPRRGREQSDYLRQELIGF